MASQFDRTPNLMKLQRAIRYLKEAGGMEVRPMFWLHPQHSEYVIIDPEGRIRPFDNRVTAFFECAKVWQNWRMPTVVHSDPAWPLLSELPQAQSPVPGVTRFPLIQEPRSEPQ